MSVPDSDMLLALSDALDTPVSTLLGETFPESPAEDLKAIAEKLEVINLQLARRKDAQRRIFHWVFIAAVVVTAAVMFALVKLSSPYMGWDLSNPETAVLGVALHAFEWVFVRLSPLLLIGGIVGIILTRKKI